MTDVKIRDFEGVTTFEDLAELATVEECVKVLAKEDKQRDRNRKKGTEDRKILKYAKEHPEEFEKL